MFNLGRSIPILLLLTTPWLSGCHTTPAQTAPAQPAAAAAQPPASPAPAFKRVRRDSAFSIYNNTAYGISFRYPRTYLLDDSSDSEDSSIADAQQELAAQQPAAALVAVVSIPADANPNTTFRSGTLQFVVNPSVTPEVCQSLAVSATPDARDLTGTSTISGATFHWFQSGDVANHLDVYTRVYTSFVHDACYEFHLAVTDVIPLAPNPAEKPADSLKILHQLDKIVSSLQIRPVSLPPAPAALPPLSIDSSPL
ncbi:MAG TPA: hypothetical protein VMR90_13415 [Candidatus Cybelea sp.]|nr:hypothetical protein [Candidatus Cybelea sp.]